MHLCLGSVTNVFDDSEFPEDTFHGCNGLAGHVGNPLVAWPAHKFTLLGSHVRQDGDDDHTIYYAINGARALTANFKAGNNWVNASGYDAIGIKFVPVGPGHEQEIYTSGTLRFSDLSSVPNGKGSAKAWINFDASGTNNLPKIRGYHGISGVERLNPGKFKITFTSGTFNHNNYVAVGSSNATTSSGSKEDFSVNTVGLVLRDKVDNNPDLRSVTCVIKNENGDYVDSEMIDCVFYGWEPNEASGAQIPTTSIASSYTDP